MTYILNEAQEAWLKALESGEYKQARGVLHDGKGFCCLGLGCLITGAKFKEEPGGSFSYRSETLVAPQEVVEALHLIDETGEFIHDLEIDGEPQSSLACANDAGYSFKQIARVIRSNPTAVFKE